MGGRQVAPARANGFSTIDGWLARNATIEHLLQEARAAKAAAERRVAEVKQRVRGEVDKSQLAGRVKAVLGSSPPGRRIAPSSAQARNRPRSNTGPTPRDQVLAGLRGAQDAFTLGLGDRIYAGGGALLDAAHGEDLGDAWRRRFDVERARDDYDRQHYKTARTVGQLAGTAAGIAAMGPIEAALLGGSRLAVATRMLAPEARLLVGVGAGGGAATQALADLQRGNRGSFGDYAGAAAGGSLTAIASVRGAPKGAVNLALNTVRGAPGRAAAMGGALTSVAQDVLNGRGVSLEDAERAALTGAYIATPLGLGGRAWSKGLSSGEKGRLGEALGRARTRLGGQKITAEQVRKNLANGHGYTVVDHVAGHNLLTEQKFGEWAKLTKNQIAKRLENPDLYRLDHFLPRDVGRMVSVPFGLLGYQDFSPAE